MAVWRRMTPTGVFRSSVANRSMSVPVNPPDSAALSNWAKRNGVVGASHVGRAVIELGPGTQSTITGNAFGDNTLLVKGDAGDTVELVGPWRFTGTVGNLDIQALSARNNPQLPFYLAKIKKGDYQVKDKDNPQNGKAARIRVR